MKTRKSGGRISDCKTIHKVGYEKKKSKKNKNIIRFNTVTVCEMGMYKITS
jgi:hypothetical protein